ncbi:hypothetical protein MTO96_011513 [Rhipicephalus appendiculatus]
MDNCRTCETCGSDEAFEHFQVLCAVVDRQDSRPCKMWKRLLALAPPELLTVCRRRQDTEERGELRSPHGCCRLRTGPHEQLRSFLLPSYTRPLAPTKEPPCRYLVAMLSARTRTVVRSTNISVSRLVFGNILCCTSRRAALLLATKH